MPSNISSEVSDPKFQSILLRVKEQTGINFVSITRKPDSTAESIVIDAPDLSSANLAKNLIETHFKQHIKLMAASAKLHEMQTNLFLAQGEMASAMVIDFVVRPELIGYVIGKKGTRVKETQEATGVSSINIKSETGMITVFGPDPVSVQKARDMLDIDEARHPIQLRHVEFYLRERDDTSLGKNFHDCD